MELIKLRPANTRFLIISRLTAVKKINYKPAYVIPDEESKSSVYGKQSSSAQE